VIEQSNDAVVTLTADQILTVISELRACYDYCAAWKQSQPEQGDCSPPKRVRASNITWHCR
jgi:hypothetical protein